MSRIEEATQTAQKVALFLVKDMGAERMDAINFGALFAVFLEKNKATARELLEEGNSPEAVTTAFLETFEKFCAGSQKFERASH